MKQAITTLEFESMLLSRHFTAMRPPSGRLDRSAYLLLSLMRPGRALSIGEISQAIGLDVSTINRQTAALVRAGLAERIPDPEGGIARKFIISEEGAQRLDTERASILGSLGRILGDWPEEEIRAFAGYLERFNRDIEGANGRYWPRA